jgi:type VI secretion system secreted protein Hcp
MPLESAVKYSDGIKGSNGKKGRAGTSAVVEFNHQVYSPRDTQMGSFTGARVHGEVEVVKEIDTASAPLYQAVCTGQVLKELAVDWYRINPSGQEEVYFTHTLTNVRVASVEQILPNTKDPAKETQGHLERLRLLYEQISWKHIEGFEFEDAWKDVK